MEWTNGYWAALAGLGVSAAAIMWLSTRKSSSDLNPAAFPKLDWSPGEIAKSLDAAFAYATGVAEKAVGWYYVKRTSKRVGGWLLRGGALLCTVFAGLVPVLGKLTETGGKPGIDSAWATIAIGVAAGMIALERFGGFTTAWVRFITAGEEITENLEGFRVEWYMDKLNWRQPDPTIEQAKAALEKVKDFLLKVDGVVRQETKSWSDEFLSAVRQLDQTPVQAVDVRKLGAVSIRVTNADQCQGGWHLSVDNGPARSCSGSEVALRGMSPDIHVFSVSGSIGGVEKRAEKAVEVIGGQVAQVTLTL
jgi:hypothetical protein